MSDSTPSGNSNAADMAAKSSPAPGCIILITILVVFGGLAILYTVVAVLQNRAFSEFTDPEPAKREVFEPNPERISEANRKTDDVLLAAVGNQMDRVLFNAEDINTLIATRELLSDFRGNTRIRKISEDGIEAEMSQPIRTGFLRENFRYLNATFFFKPVLKANTILLNVVDIQADNPERPVPEKFIKGYAGLEFFKLDPSNEDLSPALRKMGRVYLEGDKIVVETRVEIPK